MYKGPGGHVNPDDYLLGKEVDKVIVDKQSGNTQSNGVRRTHSFLGYKKPLKKFNVHSQSLCI